MADRVTFYISMEDFEKFCIGRLVKCMGEPRYTYLKIKSGVDDVEIEPEREGERIINFLVRRRVVVGGGAAVL
jgi:hypothetical protein